MRDTAVSLLLVASESWTDCLPSVTKETTMIDRNATERRGLISRVKSVLKNDRTLKFATAILRLVVFIARLFDWLG